MTQYQEGLRRDEFHIIVGMNQGDGRSFRFVEDVRRGQLPASSQILRTIESALDDDGDSSDLADWFKMDWADADADADGDRRDDLWFFWRTDWLGRHLNAGTHGRKRALSYLLSPCDAKPAPAPLKGPEPSAAPPASPAQIDQP